MFMSRKHNNLKQNRKRVTPSDLAYEKLRDIYKNLNKLNIIIAEIKSKGTTHENYARAFNLVRDIKSDFHFIEKLGLHRISNSQRRKYYKQLDYFKSRYMFLKRITKDHFLEHIIKR